MTTDLPTAPDAAVVGSEQKADLSAPSQQAPDEITAAIATQAQIETDLPTAPDAASVALDQKAELAPDLPVSADEIRAIADQQPKPPPDLPIAEDMIAVNGIAPPQLSTDLPVADGDEIGGYPELKRVETAFTGRWRPNADPLLIAKDDFSDITNMRYTEAGVEGVSGYSDVVTYTGNIPGFVRLAQTNKKGRAGCHDGTYLYIAGSDGECLYACSVTKQRITIIDTATDTSTCVKCCMHNGYIIAACGSSGLYAYSFDGTNLTLLDTHNDGGGAVDVVSDGSYIYIANSDDGIRAYTFDGSTFTNVGHRDDGGWAYQVDLLDDGYIGLANGTGVRTYSFDGSTFTAVDSKATSGTCLALYYGNIGTHGYRLYITDSDEVEVYTVSSGVLTYETSFTPQGDVMNMWGDGTYLFLVTDLGTEIYAYDDSYTKLTTYTYEEYEHNDGLYVSGEYYYVFADTFCMAAALQVDLDYTWDGCQFNKITYEAYNSLITVTNLTSENINVLCKTTEPPEPGVVYSEYLLPDTSTGQYPMMTVGPQGTVVHCAKGQRSYIWGGQESPCAGFVVADDEDPLSYTFWYDDWESVNSDDDTSYSIINNTGSTTSATFYIGSTRRIEKFKLYIKTANTESSTMSVYDWYWNSPTDYGWSSQSLVLDDGTSDDGKSLGQTGTVELLFGPRQNYARFLYGGDILLYWYKVTVDSVADGTSVYFCTIGGDRFTYIDNIWSGELTAAAKVLYYDASADNWIDKTIELADDNQSTYMDIGSMPTSDAFYIGSHEKLRAVYLYLVDETGSTTASVISCESFNGESWNSTLIYDGTQRTSGITLRRNGRIEWFPTEEIISDTYREKTTRLGGHPSMYYYKFSVSAALSAGVKIYYIECVPAVNATGEFKEYKAPGHFRFALNYKNRLLLCSDKNNENKILISALYAPDVFNGEDSQELFVGSGSALVGGATVFNRFESSMYEVALLCKENETWLLDYTGPEDYSLHQLSHTIGCIAPKTIKTCDVHFGGANEPKRNIIIWLSFAGPVMYDAGVIRSVSGVEAYFDPQESGCINYDYADRAAAFFDSLRGEYNLLIPVNDTRPDVWLIYDIVRQKWFKKEPPDYPTCGYAAYDGKFVAYDYLGFDGVIRRNEYGETYGGTAIDNEVCTRDFLPAESMWDKCRIRFLKLLCEAEASGTVELSCQLDGSASWTTLNSFGLSNTGYRYVEHIQRLNYLCSSIKFKIKLSTSTIVKGLKPIGLGFMYSIERTATD